MRSAYNRELYPKIFPSATTDSDALVRTLLFFPFLECLELLEAWQNLTGLTLVVLMQQQDQSPWGAFQHHVLKSLSKTAALPINVKFQSCRFQSNRCQSIKRFVLQKGLCFQSNHNHVGLQRTTRHLLVQSPPLGQDTQISVINVCLTCP